MLSQDLDAREATVMIGLTGKICGRCTNRGARGVVVLVMFWEGGKFVAISGLLTLARLGLLAGISALSWDEEW